MQPFIGLPKVLNQWERARTVLDYREAQDSPFARSLHQHLARCAIGVAQDGCATLLAIDWFAIQIVVADNDRNSLVCLQLFYASALNYNPIFIPRPLGLIGFFSILVHHIDCL